MKRMNDTVHQERKYQGPNVFLRLGKYLLTFRYTGLFALSLVVFVAWELCVILHPERFWEQTNEALRCANCTDKLCTQYCRKLKRAEEKKK